MTILEGEDIDVRGHGVVDGRDIGGIPVAAVPDGVCVRRRRSGSRCGGRLDRTIGEVNPRCVDLREGSRESVAAFDNPRRTQGCEAARLSVLAVDFRISKSGYIKAKRRITENISAD
jgi:hypothetical protein